MEFLKALFGNGEALTFEQLSEKIKENKLNIVNLADGSYVSKSKFDDRVNALSQQVTDLQGQIAQRDTDMASLNDKLKAAKADATKLTDAQNALTTLQSKYDTDRQAWEDKTRKQDYEFRVREKANALNFSSPAAKRDFIREATGKDFKIDGDTLLGYEDFLTKYKAENPGALVEEKHDTPPDPQTNPAAPTIVLPKTQPPEPEKTVFGFHFNGVRPKPTAN